MMRRYTFGVKIVLVGPMHALMDFLTWKRMQSVFLVHAYSNHPFSRSFVKLSRTVSGKKTSGMGHVYATHELRVLARHHGRER
ncbi:hypothetical protein Tco_1339292, partial [Tanacetum coccineum]